jgi:anti-sigma regulatory factor (Ser/Thr protein kinase)
MRSWLHVLDASAEETNDVLLAVGEACANAVEHGSRGGDAKVDVQGRVLLDRIVRLSVRDSGRWRPRPAKVGDRGRGFMLMRRLVDNVAVRRHGDGSEVILYHRLQTPPPDRAIMDHQSEEAWHAGGVP